MHNLGILHCDLKPKNFLVDEYGILKISDFKLARKLSKVSSGDSNKSVEALELRGTTAYMSPELFTAEGVHSYCSDFWAIGCVLYELRRGVPPFGWEYASASASVSLKDLVERINTAEPVGNPIVFAENNENNNNNGHNQNSNNRDRGERSYSSKTNSTTNSTPSVTVEFADLLKWLLEKQPVNRCEWPDLVTHSFWGTNTDNNDSPNNLPPNRLMNFT